DADALRDADGELVVDPVEELVHHPVPDLHRIDLPELEAAGVHEPVLPVRGDAVPEHRGLAKMVLAALAPLADLVALDALRVVDVAAGGGAGRHRAAAAERVRGVRDAAAVDGLPHEPVALVVVDGGDGPVD